MAASDLDALEFSQDGWTLRLVRRADGRGAPAPVATAAAPSDVPASRPEAEVPAAAPRELTSPLFGIVHLQRAPGESPFVRAGDTVEAGRTLCVIEAMKVFNEVCAERDVTVAAVLVESGQEVEAGQPLFRFA